MIPIFTDTSFLTEEYRSMVFPLLFYYHYLETQQIREYYQLTDRIDDVEIVIVPVHVEYFFSTGKQQLLYNFIDSALNLQKRVWVYSSGDLGLTISRKVTTFRFGGFDSKLDSETIILPAYTTDPFEILQEEFATIKKTPLPRIGFTGNAHESLSKWIKEFYVQFYYAYHRFRRTIPSDPQKFYPSGIKRYRILKKMQSDNRIKTDFIFRKAYRAGAKTDAQRAKTKKEFLMNIYQNPYTFCLRGNGNFSVRFYETLASGRIPVLVDTDCRLPLAGIVDWSKHCVLVSEERVVEDLLLFHSQIDAADFEKMQSQNRKLWTEYMQSYHFFIGVYKSIKQRPIE